jgi:pimeloyl-ACP methyl ester carboxylesterase
LTVRQFSSNFKLLASLGASVLAMLLGRLGDVTAPTLILAGMFDLQAPLQCSQELLRGLPDAKLLIFEHSGHFPFIEEPISFARAVELFLGQSAQ